ncbi:MAG: metalloprotease TldD, partial [Rickettsiales bacterium]|nr:metalloprotease TldD [Rickettsiales bacterium]
MSVDAASDLFFNRSELDRERTHRLVNDALSGLDDGELYLEYNQSEALSFDDGRLKHSSFNTAQGFGLRGVLGESTSYAHSCELSEAAIKRASDTVKAVNHGQSPAQNLSNAPFGTNQSLYIPDNPLQAVEFKEKVTLLEQIDAYVRSKDPRVAQVTASLSGVWQAVHIIRVEGEATSDIRPLVRLNVNVVVEQDGRMESGSSGAGGRVLYHDYMNESQWKKQADEALRQAL